MKRQKHNSNQIQKLKKIKTITCFENLSNEIFYEIFAYLDGFNIFMVFHTLNNRFENLLINSSMSMKCEITSTTNLDSFYESFLYSCKRQILSLEFHDQLESQDLFGIFRYQNDPMRQQAIMQLQYALQFYPNITGMNAEQLQNEGEQDFIQRRDGIIFQQQTDKWIFPNVYLTSLSSQKEEISSTVEPIDIPTELIEQVMKEPLPERKPPSRITTEKDENNPTCFPKNESIESTHVIQSHTGTVDYSKFTSIEVARFERIRVSTLTGSDMCPLSLSSITIHPTTGTIDHNIGRQGEEIVFRFLQWKYPKAQIEWMNNEQESGLPYDIRLKRKDQMEMIEVKTTTDPDQHTFQISIEEMKCLLQHPKNYHIYRV
ncbi:hypothetical protein I4U23_023231 [Adineta vaga]|nr:hypothetical protein I4U23_023231 [Adineta vaga]